MRLIYRGVAYDRQEPDFAQDRAGAADRPVLAVGTYRGLPVVLRAARSWVNPLSAWAVTLVYRGVSYGPGLDRKVLAAADRPDSADRAVDRLAKTVNSDRQTAKPAGLPAQPWPPGQTLPNRSPLYPGQRGDRVATLQAALADQGWLRGPYQPGYYGPLTDRAVRKLQRSWGVAITGIADARVWRWLEGAGDRPCPPAPPQPPTDRPDRPLQLGDRGPWVAELQARLRCRGYFAQRITGIFEAATAEAVRRFQVDRALPPTGIADAATLAALSQRDRPSLTLAPVG
jgi:peptidoglycan hydrolase-like protein with peptidoglycan-binding domain